MQEEPNAKSGFWKYNVVGIIYIHMQMRLPRPLRIPNPLFQNPLRLLDKQPMQINRIPIHSPHGIILPENIIARLPVILVRHRAVTFPFFG